MKGAFLEADHSHVPDHVRTCLNKKDQVEITAVSGRGMMAKYASSKFNVPLYDNYIDLLDNEILDFVYIFGTHRQCPEIIKEAVDRNIPFIVEKPCATKPDELVPLISKIREKGLPHVVALWRRYAPVITKYRDIVLEAAQAGKLHMMFRYITGGPDRYEKLDSGWLLDPHEAGGGFLILDGCHYIDLVRYLAMDEITDVKAFVKKDIWDTEVDDYASLILKTSKGSTATIEVGLTNPAEPDELYNMSSRDFYIIGQPGKGIRFYSRKTGCEESEFPKGDLYDINLEDLLQSIKGIKKPDITLEDAYKFLCVIEKAYKDAEA
ncbi:MAG TPA: Gfo/Idh/MocA family oxidoreductase [Sedimentibacter sp.]|nr:Gfo/Idh/MocA family oxidoreductase [Sedimentibacter sp.]